jgi:acetyl esterase/lipase
MPDAQSHQIAAMTDEANAKGFKADKHRIAYLEWFDAPAKETRTGGCMILISGGSYQNCCDMKYIEQWRKRFTELGFQCVNFVYRTPRPVGLPIWQTAWEDGQRAVRMVRSEAKKRGFDPEKIGVVSMSAGSHLALLLAANSQTPAYTPIDKLDAIPCHINWAVVNAPAYVTTDGETGTAATRQGYGKDVKLSSLFKFDEKTCPMSLHHGGMDVYSPNGSTLIYRELRKRNIPAELHLYPNIGHRALGLERAVEFMRQMGFMGKPEPEVLLMSRYTSDDARREVTKEDVWPEGKTPDLQENQCQPYLEWHFPKELKTKAIQIIYSGGAYNRSKPDSFEVAPARRYLNEKGMTVVTLHYRTPRPAKESGLAKHTTAWQDLQRAIRIVRSKADSLGLDPNKIGIMGSSAGGHLTLMGTTSSLHQSYLPIDKIDKLPCNVQWGIGIYPAYALTDGMDNGNTSGGNDDDAVLVPEFTFDIKSAPMLFIHGDSDGYASMNSVKAWEKLRAMGIQSELHTLALRKHCFQKTASPGTGSYTFLDRIGEFLQPFMK